MSEQLQDYELATIARGEEWDLWRFMKVLLEAELATLENELRTCPGICDSDFTEDVRWKLADVARIKWLLGMPDRARKELVARGDS